MLDFSWLATEAKIIHNFFGNLFYSFIGLLLIAGILLEFFKFPIGGIPSFAPLVGRCFVAAIMLVSFPDIINTLGVFVDHVSKEIGGLNEFKYVLAQMSDRLDTLTWSWTSVKQMAIVLISFFAFFALYISVYVSEAIYFYSWTLLYVFSPICFAMYVLPQTERMAIGVYTSMIKVASWKIIWSVLATLLWSAALIDLENLGDKANFLTLIIFNVMLAWSLIFTPMISNMLFKGSFANGASKVGGLAAGSLIASAGHLLNSPPLRKFSQGAGGLPQKSFQRAKSYMNQRADEKAMQRNPKLSQTPENLPSFKREIKTQEKALKKMDQAAIQKQPYLKHMPERLPSSMAKLAREEKKERLLKRRENLAKAQQRRRDQV